MHTIIGNIIRDTYVASDIAELLYIATRSLNGNNDSRLTRVMVQQNKRYVYTVPSPGIYWDPLSRTHEEFLASIRDYNSKDNLMDVLQETRRIKVKEVTRFCRKLINYVGEFVEIGDLDMFGQDKMYKVIMMESVEEQELGFIRNRFKLSKDSLDPDIEYYYNKSFSPTSLLCKLVKKEIIFSK
jgi:hypothetical protein